MYLCIMDNLKFLTNEECIDYIKNYLLNQKIKEHQIEIEESLIKFEYKNTVYQAYIEDYETIHYGVYEMYGVDLTSNFWELKDEYGDYKHIDEFFEGVVKEKRYEYVRKCWNVFDKLQENDENDDLRDIVSRYFDLY